MNATITVGTIASEPRAIQTAEGEALEIRVRPDRDEESDTYHGGGGRTLPLPIIIGETTIGYGHRDQLHKGDRILVAGELWRRFLRGNGETWSRIEVRAITAYKLEPGAEVDPIGELEYAYRWARDEREAAAR